MLVPLIEPLSLGRDIEDNTSRPGAAISILPQFEKYDGVNVWSREATDMMVGELAGAPVSEPAFPAAAIIRQLLSRAEEPAAVYAAWAAS